MALEPGAKFEEIMGIFFPFDRRERERMVREEIPFVHYTSAEAAISILENAEVWLRNSTLMNDFSEVHHGEDCWRYAWAQEVAGGRIKAILDRAHPGLSGAFETYADDTFHIRFGDTYLFSCSEHKVSENFLGRLSMWRAYGGSTNVALVLNQGPLLRPSNAVRAITSKVLYASREKFVGHMAEIADLVEANFDLISGLEADDLSRIMSVVLHAAVLSTKHPGFEEEQEWRVLYNPQLTPSTRINEGEAIKILAGVPQKLYRLPLRNVPEHGLVGVSPAELIDRIIIGPTPYPLAIVNAFSSVLERIGMPDFQRKIFISDIPLRRG